MPYRWGEHVGELELRVEAASEEEVLADAAHALAELLMGDEDEMAGRDEAPAGRDEAPARGPAASGQLFEVSLVAPDRPLLFAAWLDELVFLAETEGFVPAHLEAVALDGGRLHARVRGRRGSPPHLVKAVTHHDLRFERAAQGWSARAVLDV